MFHVLLCLLILLPFGCASAEQSVPPPAPVSSYAQLQQLSQWQRAGRTDDLRAWVRSHPVQAMVVARDLMVDVYASPWLMLPPQIPDSQILLPLLLQEMHLPPPPDPRLCGWQEMPFWSDGFVTPTVCERLPGYGNLLMLNGMHWGLNRILVETLQSETFAHKVTATVDFDLEPPASERFDLQKYLLEGRTGSDFPGRRKSLAQALSLARKWHARESETLVRIALAETNALEVRRPFYAHEPTKQKRLQQSRLQLQQAQELAASLHSDSLLTQVALARAGLFHESEAFTKATQLIQKQTGPYRQVLELQLADAFILANKYPEGRKLYRQLLAKADKAVKLAAIEHLHYLADRHDIEWMGSIAAHEKDPELKKALLEKPEDR